MWVYSVPGKKCTKNIVEIIIYLPLPHILGAFIEENISYLRRCWEHPGHARIPQRSKAIIQKKFRPFILIIGEHVTAAFTLKIQF